MDAWDERHAATPLGWVSRWSQVIANAGATFVRVALIAMLVGLAGCQLVEPSEPPGTALLRQYGLQPTGPTESHSVEVGPPREIPWDLYLEASREIGLDFASRAGSEAQLETTPVAGQPPVRAHVLTIDGTVVGAWLSAEDMVPGIFALSERP